MGHVEELAHTADVGFRVRAETPERLFELAAVGLVRALGLEAGEEEAAEEERVDLSRPDRERLLVAWLRELLGRAMAEGTVPRAEAESVNLDGDDVRVRARVRWSPAASGPAREIKGVTYHGLEVEQSGEGWHATVVLDV